MVCHHLDRKNGLRWVIIDEIEDSTPSHPEAGHHLARACRESVRPDLLKLPLL